MDSPIISVVMSVYNGLPYLHKSIQSILNQTYANFEFIIINDGSQDSTWLVLSEYASTDKRIKLINNCVNIGYTRSLNKGMAVARGEYIARQDADDISNLDRFNKQVNYLSCNPKVGLVGTYAIFIDSNGNEIPISNYTFVEDNNHIQRELIDSNCIRHGSVMFRRRLLDSVGLYNPELEPSEDYDMWLRIGEVTEITNIPEPLYLYREHPGAESSKRRFQQIKNKAISLENAAQRRFGSNIPYEYRQTITRDFVRAGVIAFITGRFDSASDCINHANSWNPALFDAHEPIFGVCSRYSYVLSHEESISLIITMFNNLFPNNSVMTGVRNKILEQLYIKAAYHSYENRDTKSAYYYAKHAVLLNKHNLLNRGILSIIVHSRMNQII